MCKTFEQMKDEGRREGLIKGEDKLTSLLCLLSDEDLQRFKTSKGSKEIREELYKKYGIE